MREEAPWNRCDYCGRFIALRDFDEGLAVRDLDTPDSHFTRETWDTYHVKCHEEKGYHPS